MARVEITTARVDVWPLRAWKVPCTPTTTKTYASATNNMATERVACDHANQETVVRTLILWLPWCRLLDAYVTTECRSPHSIAVFITKPCWPDSRPGSQVEQVELRRTLSRRSSQNFPSTHSDESA